MSDIQSDSSIVIRKEVSILTSDGINIAAVIFSPSTERSLGVAIVASGVGLIQDRYREYATYLASIGWTVLTFDYRGIGASTLPENLQSNSRLRDWGKYDLAACIDWADVQLSAKRIILVAHSVGGQIFAFAPNQHKVESMIAICAQKGYWRFWDGFRKFNLLGLWYLLPILVKLYGYLPLRILGKGADIPAGIAHEWGRWGRYKAFVDERGQSLNAEFAKVSCRILAISLSDDKFYAPRRAVEALNAVYTSSELSHWHLTPKQLGTKWLGHFGFFRNKTTIHALWKDVDSWLDSNENHVDQNQI